MRYRIYTYIHLVIIVLYILRPVMPYIDYAINKEYIAKNLCINRDTPLSCCEGKCYLEKQIKNSIESNNSKENDNNKKVQNEEVSEFLIAQVAKNKIFEKNTIHSVNHASLILSNYHSAIFIPPQF